MAGDQERFLQLITGLLSNENEIRNQAETAYDNIPVENKISHLLATIRSDGSAEELRQMAAVLLRRVLSNEFEEFYTKLPAEQQNQLKSEVLLAVQQDMSGSMRRKVCEVAAEVARNLIDEQGENKWPEFLRFLFDSASSPNPLMRESALQMFGSVPGVFGNQQQNYLDVIKQMLLKSLMDTSNPPVQIASVRATSSFLMAHDQETQILKHFSDLLSPLFQVVSANLEGTEGETLVKCLVDMAENVPKFLRSEISNILGFCVKVVCDTNQTDNIRQLTLEIVLTLAERAPAMLRKTGDTHMALLIPQLLKMMTELDDVDDWSIQDEVAEDDNDSNCMVAESGLDRLACGIGGKTMLPHVIREIPQMLGHQDWKYRHAALMAVSAVGEGCHKQMEGILPQIMDGGVLNFLQDPHPRVRYAACNAIGQMATDFAPTFEKKFHDKVVPGLLMLLDDYSNPRVQAHAGAALVNFCEDCPKNILNQYLDSIIVKLESVLTAKFRELVEKGTKLVLEQIVTTIASVADAAEETFVQYYDRFMPCLKYIIQNATTPELKVLRGKTFECVSLIGLAVGADQFIPDATEVMDLLLKTQTGENEIADDDPQLSYLISTWAYFCKIMGKRFEPYLPMVMGPVMRTASLKPEVAVLDAAEMQDLESEDDWQVVPLGEQQNFAIRTAGLEDKSTACQMLVCYAKELKDGFAEYAESVVKLMVPMLKFYFHEGVRVAAAESLPFLLECAEKKGPQYVNEMWAYIFPELMKAAESESELSVLVEELQSLAKCIETLGNTSLTPETMKEVTMLLHKTMEDHFKKADQRQEKRKDEDYDEDVEDQLLVEKDEDVFLLSKVADVLHSLFLTYRTDVFPFFDQLLPLVLRLMERDRNWNDRQWALCIFDDVIEFGGPECVKYQQYFLQPMLAYCTDTSPEVRQAATYGLGVLGQFGGKEFSEACASAVPRLLEVINAPESRTSDNANPTENAISAITKILKWNNSRLNVDEILPHWLSWLPVTEDDDEAPFVYGYLADLIEGNHPLILGNNNSNLPRLVAIIAESFIYVVKKDSECFPRLVNIVRQVQSNNEVFQACASSLTPAQQEALAKALAASS